MPARLRGDGSIPYVAAFCLISWVCVGLAVALLPVTRYYPDYSEYTNMVLGHLSEVNQPFIDRVLAPEIARSVVMTTGLEPTTALEIVCQAGWALVPVLGGMLLRLRKVSFAWAVVIATLPYPALAARFYLVPDAWAVSFVLVIFIALEYRSEAVAGAFATGLAFARSSSIFAVTLQLLAGWRRNGWRATTIIVTAFAFGLWLKAPLMQGSQDNHHHLPGVVYLIGKIASNGLSNILGAELFTNTFRDCPKPLVTIPIGRVPGMGAIREIGLCAIHYRPVGNTLLCYLFIFGALPLAAAARLRGAGFRRADRADTGWREMAVFLFAFLLCPLFGATITRLFVEAFPLLFIAAGPVTQGKAPSPIRAAALIGYNLIGFLIIVTASPD